MNDPHKDRSKDQAMVDTHLDLTEEERKAEVERRIEQSRQAYEEYKVKKDSEIFCGFH